MGNGALGGGVVEDDREHWEKAGVSFIMQTNSQKLPCVSSSVGKVVFPTQKCIQLAKEPQWKGTLTQKMSRHQRKFRFCLHRFRNFTLRHGI